MTRLIAAVRGSGNSLDGVDHSEADGQETEQRAERFSGIRGWRDAPR